MNRYNLILKALSKIIDWLSTSSKSTKAAGKLVPRSKFIVLNKSSMADEIDDYLRSILKTPTYGTLSDLRIGDILSGEEVLSRDITDVWDPVFSLPELEHYVRDDAYKEYLEAVREARLDALDYFTSDLRKLVDAEHAAEARSLGMTYHPNTYSEFALTRPLFVYNTDLGKNKYGDTFKLRFITNNDKQFIYTKAYLPLNIMRLNAFKKNDYPVTAYHENLHIGNLGRTEGVRFGEPLDLTRKRMKDNEEYLIYKTMELMISPEELADKALLPLERIYSTLLVGGKQLSLADVIYNPEECAVDMMEVGKVAGIKPGDPYPGDEKFDLIYNELISSGKNCDRLLHTKHTTPLEKRNVWKALNGTFFLLPAALLLGTGYYMLNKNNPY